MRSPAKVERPCHTALYRLAESKKTDDWPFRPMLLSVFISKKVLSTVGSPLHLDKCAEAKSIALTKICLELL
jgi:hypothetical protein